MLEGVELDSDKVSNNCKLISGKITLSFKEYNTGGKTTAAKYLSKTKSSFYQNDPIAIADKILKVFYNGKNINKVWDGCKPQNEDLISITCGVVHSEISSPRPVSALYASLL